MAGRADPRIAPEASWQAVPNPHIAPEAFVAGRAGPPHRAGGVGAGRAGPHIVPEAFVAGRAEPPHRTGGVVANRAGPRHRAGGAVASRAAAQSLVEGRVPSQQERPPPRAPMHSLAAEGAGRGARQVLRRVDDPDAPHDAGGRTFARTSSDDASGLALYRCLAYSLGTEADGQAGDGEEE